MKTETCKHTDWEFQAMHSAGPDGAAATSVRRYKCSGCGCWGWRHADKIQQNMSGSGKSIQPYSNKDVLVSTPLKSWRLSGAEPFNIPDGTDPEDAPRRVSRK